MATPRLLLLVMNVILFMACGSKESPRDEGGNDLIITYYSDSTVKEIVQKRNDVLEGKAFRFNNDGTKLWEFNFIDGKKEGTQFTYQGGQLIRSESFKDNKLNGWAKSFTGPCGSVSEEGQYIDDKMDGLWYNYYGSELLEISLYKNDTLLRVVYRNKKYPDRKSPLPTIELDCIGRREAVK